MTISFLVVLPVLMNLAKSSCVDNVVKQKFSNVPSCSAIL